MARELNQDFFSSEDQEKFSVSLEDWKEAQQELSLLKSEIKKAQGGDVFLYAKLVQLFDTVKKRLNHLQEKQTRFEARFEQKLQDIKSMILSQKEMQDKWSEIKKLLDSHNNKSRKYDYQLQDLSRSLSQQSEQVWSLTDQLQEIKEEIKEDLNKET